MVNTRTRNTADGFASLRDAPDCLSESFTNDTPPVRGHANLQSRVSQDRWSPLDCVNFGHESTVDDACFVEDLITTLLLVCIKGEAQAYSPCPLGMAIADRITDSVVLESKQSVQHLYAEPPVVVEACLGSAIVVARKEDLFPTDSVEDKFSVLVAVSQTRRDNLTRAVDLGTIPPGCVHVAVSRARGV